MFPTGVGMNRATTLTNSSLMYVPHRRGDEPLSGRLKHTLTPMFPTGVGMNRDKSYRLDYLRNVPHRRGDEP